MRGAVFILAPGRSACSAAQSKHAASLLRQRLSYIFLIRKYKRSPLRWHLIFDCTTCIVKKRNGYWHMKKRLIGLSAAGLAGVGKKRAD
jgi:hypothetical protein